MTDFVTISNRYSQDKQMPVRAYRLSLLKAVLDGSFYDVMPHRFHEEDNGAGQYVPLHDRSPCVKYGIGLLRTVVEDSVSFLFGEGRFPSVDSTDETIRDTLFDIMKESKLPQIMCDAAFRGSIGSVAIQMRVLKGRLFFKVLDTINLTPEYDPEEPDRLMRVVEKYKVRGEDLANQGYTIPADMMKSMFWFMRVFDDQAENWYLPWPVSREKNEAPPRLDDARSVQHRLGFCPFVWIKNLVGGDDLDGASTFACALDTAITMDYQISQAGRALKYSADPLLLLKEPAQTDGPMIRTSSNAIVVDKDGDGKLLEIGGTATAAVGEYVSKLREYLLETIHGNRTNADRLGGTHVSSAALKMLHHPVIMLADNLRASYGEDGLLCLLRMILKAADKVPLKVNGKSLPKLKTDEAISLRWPDFFPPTPGDRQMQAATMVQLRDGGMLSRDTAVKVLAPSYDIEDVNAELRLIDQDEAEAAAKAMAEAAQVKASETLPL